MSSSNTQLRAVKRRDYRLGKRAEKQDETRRRIVEAALELHCTVGPARTTVSQIAERAGVQRHTYYAHFPEERQLFLACSGLALERDPLPDVDKFRSLPAGAKRLRRGLEQFYGWYERNAGQAACVLRDAEHHELTRETVDLRMAPVFREATTLLGEGLSPRARAMLGLALDFGCWRNLTKQLTSAQAAQLMADAVCAL